MNSEKLFSFCSTHVANVKADKIDIENDIKKREKNKIFIPGRKSRRTKFSQGC